MTTDLPFSISSAPFWPSEPDHSFALVLAAIEAGQRVGAGVHSLENILFIVKVPGANPVGEHRDARFPFVHMVEDHEALHAGALDEDMAFDARPRRDRKSTRLNSSH